MFSFSLDQLFVYFKVIAYLQCLHDAAAHAAAVLRGQVELVLDVHHHAVSVLLGVQRHEGVGHVGAVIEQHEA